MLTESKRRKAALQVRPGNGRKLKTFRWWQPFFRALLYLPLTTAEGRPVVYAVDVHYRKRLLSDDGNGKAELYLNGKHHAESKLPAAFRVQGGTIEVEPSDFGLKRCHYVTAAGVEQQLSPDRDSAEGLRARLHREHPTLSRWIGILSTSLLVISLILVIPQLVEAVFLLPPVRQHLGTFVSPIQLPIWLNTTLGVGAAVASTERSLRLRYNWLLDSAAG